VPAVRDTEFADEEIEHPVAGGFFDLEAHRRSEPPSEQFTFKRL
jgi:hypothetical protein